MLLLHLNHCILIILIYEFIICVTNLLDSMAVNCVYYLFSLLILYILIYVNTASN